MADETVPGGESLAALLHEQRRFEPPAAFAAQANAQPGIYEEAAADRLRFWEQQAERLEWGQRWERVLDWELPFAKWFVGGKLNVSVNCVDRHVAAGLGERVAFHWEGEPGDTRTITYATSSAWSARRRTPSSPSGCGPGTRWPSTCPCSPRRWPPCWRAPASAPPTRWSSGASRPRLWRVGSRTATPGW